MKIKSTNLLISSGLKAMQASGLDLLTFSFYLICLDQFETVQTLTFLRFCSEAVMSFTEKVSKLDLMARRMIMESFGISENYIDKHLKSTNAS